MKLEVDILGSLTVTSGVVAAEHVSAVTPIREIVYGDGIRRPMRAL